MDSNNFIEGKDFEVTKDGKVVMTESYLLKEGGVVPQAVKTVHIVIKTLTLKSHKSFKWKSFGRKTLYQMITSMKAFNLI